MMINQYFYSDNDSDRQIDKGGTSRSDYLNTLDNIERSSTKVHLHRRFLVPEAKEPLDPGSVGGRRDDRTPSDS